MGATGVAKPRSLALTVSLGLGAAGLAALVFALFAALSNPPARGYAEFARGSLKKLQVLDAPPPQSQRPFQTADGARMTLKSFRGRVVVMNLWGTWCAPCVEEMPTLGALAGAYKDRPLSVVAINVDPTRLRQRAVTDLQRLSGGALTFYADPTLAIALESGASRGMPVTVIYARDGREIGRVLGAADWMSAEARALIDAALAE